MLDSLFWEGLAAPSLLVGAVLALVRTWSAGLIGIVLGFGAGALIAGVSFELAEEGLRVGGAVSVAIGLALGALVFYGADRFLTSRGARSGGQTSGVPLALGTLLDGIPEQAVPGIGLAQGSGISAALLVAIFVSNLPEAVGSSADMLAGGRSRRFVLTLWVVVGVICTPATGLGYVVADLASGPVLAGIDGFAAGALLVMLIDAMIPEAKDKAQDRAGLATVAGFALAAGLSLLT